MPLKEATFRQFFRIVTSKVSLWYRDHSTPNPLGVEPDPEITRTVVGDKFSEEGVEVVSRDQDLDTPSLSDQPRDLDTEDTEAGILATAPALIENSSISVLSILTKTV